MRSTDVIFEYTRGAWRTQNLQDGNAEGQNEKTAVPVRFGTILERMGNGNRIIHTRMSTHPLPNAEVITRTNDPIPDFVEGQENKREATYRMPTFRNVAFNFEVAVNDHLLNVLGETQYPEEIFIRTISMGVEE